MTVQDVVLSKPNEKVKALKESIEESTTELLRQMEEGKSETLIRYLEFCAKFHDYSFRNLMLALWQRPTLTRLAGLHAWNKLGRRVKKGEKGISILAPVFTKVNELDSNQVESAESRLVGFRVVYVFDEAQTEGDPLPDLVHARGDPGDLIERLESRLQESGIVVERTSILPGNPGALGSSIGGKIIIRNDLSAANAFRVLVHEFAHEKLHHTGDEKESKTVRETEADATAFVVCRHFGIDCDSSDYLLLYDATPEILLSRLERIRKTACEIIEAVKEEKIEEEAPLVL